MLGQAVPQREKQMEDPKSTKISATGAWDFQRRFQVKPNYGSARNFRMRVPLPYCNSGIGYSVLRRPCHAETYRIYRVIVFDGAALRK